MLNGTDMPELEGLILLPSAAHAPLAVATEVVPAEGIRDKGSDFCGVSEPPGLLTVIRGVCDSTGTGWLVGKVAGDLWSRVQT